MGSSLSSKQPATTITPKQTTAATTPKQTTTASTPKQTTTDQTYTSPFHGVSPAAGTNLQPSVNVFKGDLVVQHVDVLAVCSSSKILFDSICRAGGDSFGSLYKTELKKNAKASVIAVKPSGQLSSKIVYFLPWTTDPDKSVLCKSIEKFVSDAIEKAVNEKYRSIAFPAIGCGKLECPISIVAKAMVDAANQKLSTHPIYVSFIIQTGKDDVFDEFRKQINSIPKQQPSQPSPPSQASKTISTTISQGIIEVEMGDITKQTVDVIIGTPAAAFLMQAIIAAGGNEIQTAYDSEYTKNPNSLLVSTLPGTLPCKRIFFLKWQPNADEEILRQSLVDLVWTVCQHIVSHNFTSVAFPAIGCGKYACSVDIVVKTLVKEIKYQLTSRKYSLTVKFVIQPNQQNVYDEFCKQVLMTENVNVAGSLNYTLPSTWEKSVTKNHIRFVLSPTTQEYITIVTNFDQTMKGNYTQIIQIERIQNERWYTQYLLHSQDFKKRLKTETEKCLYHGCPEDIAHLIIDDCFNRNCAAGVNETQFGVGVYFSSNAVYSHKYATVNTKGERYMFVARVLVGNTTQGTSSMKVRPIGFDSTTDGSHIFVTYHDAQAYADYLITYK